MTLTEAGKDYVEACKGIIEQIDDAERQVSGEYRSPKGDLADIDRAVQRSIHDAHGEDCTDAAEGDAMPTI